MSWNALDNLCSSAGDVAARNGEFIHVGRLHPHSVGTGSGNGPDPNHSGTKPNLNLGRKLDFPLADYFTEASLDCGTDGFVCGW